MSCISVQKHVNYGEVILIVGDCHKIQWNVQNGIQMQWNQDDIWTVTLDSCCLPMNYRYVVVKQDSRQIVQWEDGITRVFNSHQDVQDIWGHLRITLKFMNYPDSNITLNLYTQTGRHKIPLNRIEGECTQTFQIPNKSIHQLAYKYQSNEKWERGGVRMIHSHPIINNVIHITDSSVDFNINYNRVFENLYVGSFIYIDEIRILQDLGVNAILNLQTVEDLINKDLPEDYFDQLHCQSQSLGIIYLQCPIKDCNKRSYLQNGIDAYQTLRKLLDQGKCVYVHCTDGIQRSVQTIILYMVQDLNYTLEQAIELVQVIRPRSKPIREVLQKVLNL
ncbi:unnamed protein product [Paramecium octaurelia]|uniref:Uncharacterized protein n=1 Tax=Paramecium octaurelia TaxID=43137 RepID=A0A8S1XDR3_PAROT|nr:unnamed protein product [Paramecium octaurelia]